MSESSPTDDQVAAGIRSVAATVAAPEALRDRLQAQRAAATHDGRARARARRRAPYALVAALALAALVIAVLPGAGPAAPSIADAAAFALLGGTGTQPAAVSPRAPSVDGVTFPDLAYGSHGWRALGVRRQNSGGHELVVVSYAGRGHTRVGYAIVSSPALALPARARRLTYAGTRFAVLGVRGATVLTWRRAGRTCVLASRTASEAQLLALASWS